MFLNPRQLRELIGRYAEDPGEVVMEHPNHLSPVRQRTRPAGAWLIAPAALVTPTTNSDMAMACLASSPAR